MKRHIRVYREFFGYGEQDAFLCECCRAKQAVDVHHIRAKGMGGNKKLDVIENIIGVCRSCHEDAHRNPVVNSDLVEIAQNLERRLEVSRKN
jgi:hypothetical protein